MKTLDDYSICKKHAVQGGDGCWHVNLDGFAEACFNGNTISDLRLVTSANPEISEADRDAWGITHGDSEAESEADRDTWGITHSEWVDCIERALAAKLIDDNDGLLPIAPSSSVFTDDEQH